MPIGIPEQAVGALLEAGLGEGGGRLVEVVWVLHDMRIEEELVRRALRPVLRDRLPRVHLVDDRLPVNRIGHALAELLVLEPLQFVLREAAAPILVEGEEFGAERWAAVVDVLAPRLLPAFERRV